MGMAAILQRLGALTIDLLFPPRCFGCGKENTFLCEPCLAALPRLAPPYCQLCAQPLQGQICGRCRTRPLTIDGIRAPFLMQDSIRDGVHRLKYNNLRSLAPTLGGLLADFVERQNLAADAVVPVPLHRRRMAERGYNQAALLARELAKASNLSCLEAVKRVQSAPPQARALSSDQRRLNVHNAFAAPSAPVQGLRLLLVDDVCTTGATLAAAARALTAAGAASVWGIALAREP